MPKPLSGEAKKRVDKAYADFLRSLADTVETGEYYLFEHNTTNTYTPAGRFISQRPIGVRMTFTLEARTDG